MRSAHPDFQSAATRAGATASSRRRLSYTRAAGILATAGCAVLLAACGSSGGGSGGSDSGQVPLSAHQTIVWAIQGGDTGGAIGTEPSASAHEVAAFEKKHPNIKVQVVALSEDQSTALGTVDRDFLSKSSTPDVIDAGTQWIGPFANAHFILPLSSWGLTSFLPGASAATSYDGTLYGALWYYNAEGLFYRTDLVKSPPKTPAQLVADAQTALRNDPQLKEGIALEGNKYEGAVTMFIDMLRAFGGSFDPAHFDTPQNLAALQYLHDLVYKYKIAPQAIVGWEETQADQAFQSGKAAFEINYPFALQEINAKGSALKGKARFIPFPTTSGAGTATVASDALVVNARTKHRAAAEALVKFLLSPAQQQARAITSGDPPSVSGAYNASLFGKAPYFRQDLVVFKTGYPRLVSAKYAEISSDVQTMLSSVLANQQPPAAALKTTAAQIASLAQ
jgi:multiple sugar transport system substrate-binding protein